LGDLRATLQTTLGDAYQIERELGGGGMSRVFVATETSLGRRVVVKVLPSELAAGVSIDRFRREIALAASMQHPHIVPLRAAGASAEPLWFTMPYIEGQSLRARLARGGELPIAEAVRILREVADALAYAHRHGVVHRDIKPENVLLSEGHAMVMDFGVAKAISDSTAAGVRMTDAGVALGTPTYMSPEQASADPQVDHRADIYAFGVLAFELLTGQPPFAGASAAQVVRAHLTETAPSVATLRDAVPPLLADLVARCLVKRAADRPQSAEELLSALDTLTTPTATLPYVSGAGVPVARWKAWLRWASATVVVLGVGIAALYLKSRTSPSTRPRVVVAPFTNATGDKSFDEHGTIFASLAQDAFMRTELFDVADFRALTISTDNAKAVTVGQGPSGVRAYAAAAGATRVLTGSIFKLGDSLEFRATIVDPKDGTILVAVDPVRVPAMEPMPGMERLAQQAAGALATTTNSTTKGAFVGATHMPMFRAYREFNAGVEAFSVSDYENASLRFQAALAADPAFLSARVWLVRCYNMLMRLPKATVTRDSVVSMARALNARRAELSPLDQAVVEASNYAFDGRMDLRLGSMRRAARIWPDRYATNLVMSLNYAGRPREALEVANTMDPTRGFLRGWVTHYGTLLEAHLLMGDASSALKAGLLGRAQHPNRKVSVCIQAIALAASGRTREADSLIAEMPETEELGLVGSCRDLYALYVMSWRPATEGSNAARAQLAWLESDEGLAASGGAPDRATIWKYASFLRDSTRSLAMADSLARANPTDQVALLRVALAHAIAGHRALALQKEQEALALPASKVDNGAIAYWRSQVAAQFGDRSRAVELIREAAPHGYWLIRYLYEPNWRPLHGYAPFEALIVR
jgi:serine/threonine protein kinase/tetratricopeptide (TPR) repeat protein